MPSSLAIGDFSRATHLNIKTLRHYHRIGLLVPAHVDPGTGHRRYGTDQIPTAQVIRRFRALEMPLEEIQAVVSTKDLAARNELIAEHLRRLEDTLTRTQDAAASLRDLLEPPIDATPVTIEHRRMLATPAAAVSEVIDVRDATAWYQGALNELHALLAAQKVSPTGVGGAIYANDLFTHERGQATIFVPCAEAVRETGRVCPLVVPEVDLALTVHIGPHGAEIDFGLRFTGHIRERPCARRRRAYPRVLRHRTSRDSGRGGMAHRDRVADLRCGWPDADLNCPCSIPKRLLGVARERRGFLLSIRARSEPESLVLARVAVT